MFENGIVDPTSIAPILDSLVIVGNAINRNIGKLAYFTYDGTFLYSEDLIIDEKCKTQHSYLAYSPNGSVHVYGNLEYDDSLAQNDNTKSHQSFVQLIYRDDAATISIKEI